MSAERPQHRLLPIIRIAALLLGGAFLAWGVFDDRFRDHEGGMAARILLPWATGVALLIVATVRQSRCLPSAGWFGLAIVSQAMQLQLVDAGRGVRYQHYRPIAEMLQSDRLPLIFFTVQLLLVSYALFRRLPRILDWLQSQFRLWQFALFLVSVFFCGATLSREVAQYAIELCVSFLLTLLSFSTVLLMVLDLPVEVRQNMGARFQRTLEGTCESTPLRNDGRHRFAYVLAVLVTVVTGLMSIYVYERHPHIPDEVVYLYQARYFAQGKLAMEVPPVPAAFNLYLLEIGSIGWYAVTPPGWPAMLAIGDLCGAPWMVNPVLAGINIVLAYHLVLAIFGRFNANLSILLLSVSPWYLFLGMSFMPHMSTLVCALLAANCVERCRQTGHIGWGWLGGASLGVLSLIRPLDALFTAIMLGLWSIGVGGRRIKLAGVAGLVLGSIIVGATVFPYNKAYTGNARAFPIMDYSTRLYGEGTNSYGFGENRGMGWPLDPNPGHGPRDAIINSNLNATAMNVELFGWSTGSLWPIVLLVLLGRFRRGDGLMFAFAGGVYIGYFFNYFSGGPDFGARYWFLMIVPLTALASRIPQAIAQNSSRPQADLHRVLIVIGALVVSATMTFIPWRSVDKYYHFRDMRADIRRLERRHNFGTSLVLINGAEVPDFASAAFYNPLDLQSSATIYAWNRDADVRAELLRAYADRPLWIVDGPSVTGSGFRVVQGPLDPRAGVESQTE